MDRKTHYHGDGGKRNQKDNRDREADEDIPPVEEWAILEFGAL